MIGKVKTRVAVGSNNDEALRIYKLLLDKTRKVTEGLNAEKHLFYSDQICLDDEWDTKLYNKHLQAEGDLGDKMLSAFQTCFQLNDGAESRVIIIGSDCPYLSEEIIDSAFSALNNHEVVIGPTFDGGYYLLGMNHLYSELFENLPWSTEEVLKLTIEKIKYLGLTYTKTVKLNDVDTYNDWLTYQKDMQSISYNKNCEI